MNDESRESPEYPFITDTGTVNGDGGGSQAGTERCTLLLRMIEKQLIGNSKEYEF